MVDAATARTVLVTGATSGIGLATVRVLARRGAHVVMHGRSPQAANAALESVLEEIPSASLQAVHADLSSMAEVRRLAREVESELPRLDVLVHNAGLERWRREMTAEGHELTFAVNHLAPFLLSRLLLAKLQASAPSRVVFVSSLVIRWGRMHWDDLSAEQWYSPEPVYYQSKLAAALGAMELSRRVESTGVSVHLVPPGLVRTQFSRDFEGPAATWTKVMGPLLFRDPSAPAQEIAAVALDEGYDEVTGAYVDKGMIGLPPPNVLGRRDQARIWKESCALLELDPDSPPPNEESTRSVQPTPPKLGTWVARVTTGEVLGFTLTALVAYLAVLIGGLPSTTFGDTVALLVMTCAGAIEGACLGYFQWSELRRWIPTITKSAWLRATMLVAAGGWFFGMLVPLIGGIVTRGAQASAPTDAPFDPGMAATLAFASVFGLVVGAVFGGVQWWVLRRHAERAGVWIVANMVGWAIGLPSTYLAGMLSGDTLEAWKLLGAAALAALWMGASVALFTGLMVKRITPRLS